jgi:hypothetical protein
MSSVTPRWYMPSLARSPQVGSMPSEQLGASARRLKERLMTVAPKHFEMCVPNSVPDASGSVVQLKQMLQAAGWICDKCYSSSSAPLGFEIMAPADSESANIIYDWAQSVGYRPHFLIREASLQSWWLIRTTDWRAQRFTDNPIPGIAITSPHHDGQDLRLHRQPDSPFGKRDQMEQTPR